MDAITQEAIDALNSFIDSLIPATTLPGQEFDLLVLPTEVLPTGIGQAVGMHDDPYGEIIARRLSAEAQIAITSREDQNTQSVSSVTQALLNQDRTTLRENGVFRISFSELSDPVLTPGQGNNVNSTRTASFDVLYEFLKIPTESEGVITEIDVDMDMAVSDGKAEFILNENFTQDIFDQLEIADDDQATTSAPSAWIFNDTENRVEQSKRIRGGGLTTASAKKAGTYLLLPTSSDYPDVADCIFETELEYASGDGTGDGIGFVFRYQDINNFYYFIMSERNGYRLMGKKVDGTFNFLDVDGLDSSAGYVGNTRYLLKIVTNKSTFQVYLDDKIILSGSDETITDKGRVGLMCHGNGAAHFYGMRLVGFL